MRIKLAKQALAIAVTLLTSLSLAGCFCKGGIQISAPGCGNSCPPTPEFLYATGTNQILAFTINPSTGALGPALAMSGPNQSLGVTGTVTLGHLYVSDFLNDAVDGFSITSSSGGLTPITGSPFTPGGTPPGAGGLSAIVSAGTYVYATDLNAGQWLGLPSTRPVVSLRQFPALLLPQATRRSKRCKRAFRVSSYTSAI
jgi:hypothetical protein